jgi:hypothetical protein
MLADGQQDEQENETLLRQAQASVAMGQQDKEKAVEPPGMFCMVQFWPSTFDTIETSLLA